MQPRNRVWTTVASTKIISSAGQAGQQADDVGTNLQAGIGISHLVGYTLGPFYLDLLVESDTDNAGIALNRLHVGVGIYAGSIDPGDFPDLSLYDGDWPLYGTMAFQSPGAVSTIVVPESGSHKSIVSRASRRIDRVGEVPWLVFQQSGTEDYRISYSLSYMALMP